MKDQSIAKLCAQCEEYYSEAMKMMEREQVMMSLDKDWTSHVNIVFMQSVDQKYFILKC